MLQTGYDDVCNTLVMAMITMYFHNRYTLIDTTLSTLINNSLVLSCPVVLQTAQLTQQLVKHWFICSFSAFLPS